MLNVHRNAWFRDKDFTAGQILRKSLPEPADGRLVAVDKNNFFRFYNVNVSAETLTGSMSAEVEFLDAAAQL